MKLKLGLKHYNVVKITNFKGKIFLKNPENNILFYPNTNFISTYSQKNTYNIFITDLDYQILRIYRNTPPNKFIHEKQPKQNIHIFLIENHIKDKLLIGSILKLEN